MKDYKYTTVNKQVRLGEWSTGDYGITFFGGGHHRNYFEFSKNHTLKFKQHISAYGAGKAVKDHAKNWEDFKRHVEKCLETDQLPAYILRLVRWRFSNLPKYKYVEERMGCIVYFRKVEI
ncbi:MAG: hypothetical protein O3C66_02060 [Proteobacteria bacterium]|nr:hypothetical protein [Pseudomonadota bacterium]